MQGRKMRFTLSQLVLLLMIYSGGALNNRPVIGEWCIGYFWYLVWFEQTGLT